MKQEEQYHNLMCDDEADYRHQQLIEEWQYADHFKPQDNGHLRETTGTERESGNDAFGCMGV